MSSGDITPAPARTVANALRRYGALEALKDIVSEQQAELRDFIKDEAAIHERRTGTAAKFGVRDIGIAYVTQPGRAMVVTDDARWAQWADEHFPRRVGKRTDVNAARLLALCETDAELSARLHREGVLADTLIVDDGLLAEVGAGMCAAVEQQGVERFVDVATGELLPITTRPTGRPVLTIRIEKPARERFIAQLRDLGAPGLPRLADDE